MSRLINKELVQFLRIPAWRKWGSTEGAAISTNIDDLFLNKAYPLETAKFPSSPAENNLGLTYVGRTRYRDPMTNDAHWHWLDFEAKYYFSRTPENFVFMSIKINEDGMPPIRAMYQSHCWKSPKRIRSFKKIKRLVDKLIAMPEFNTSSTFNI